MRHTRLNLLDPPFLASASTSTPPSSCLGPYTPGQATNVLTIPGGFVDVYTQADVDQFAGYDGAIGDINVYVDGLDWTPASALIELDGAFNVWGYAFTGPELTELPALRWASGAVYVSVPAGITVIPPTYFQNLRYAYGAYLSDGGDVTTASGVFPQLHSVGYRAAMGISHFGAVDATNCFPCLESGLAEISGGGSEYNIAGAFPNLVTMPYGMSSYGLRFTNCTLVNVTGAFPLLSNASGINISSMTGGLMPTLPSLTTVNLYPTPNVQINGNGGGIDFSGMFPALTYIYQLQCQYNDNCRLPQFPLVATMDSYLWVNSNTNIIGGLPIFESLVTCEDRIEVQFNEGTPQAWVGFPVLTRTGPVGGPPYQYVLIDGNTILNAMVGAFDALAFGSDFTISNNPNLPTAAQAQAVIDHIVNVNGYAGTTSNTGNGPG